MSDANDHKLTDSNRLNGSSQPTITLETNTTGAEYDDSGGGSDATTAFNSDGFTIGTNGNYNTDGNEYIAWQWAVNGGTLTSFTESSNNPGGTRQVNTTAGISIVTYTGTGGAGTVAHGLGVTPKMIWIKDRDEAGAWIVYHENLGNTNFMRLNVTTASASESSNFNRSHARRFLF